ncbi:ATP-binding protein [uncultured Draconibacterium sp.]|uniref:ATP-binding protein n=1 Tax=uncultured Draconibacterium sp. TaxID=1573823 RepID=UPI0025ED6D5D|nr:ATP-binding protein [uncultured Draconibacterium sp.]
MPGKKKSEIRNRIIGLGENSHKKSYYPQLLDQLEEVKRQRDALENKTKELQDLLVQLSEAKEKAEESERLKSAFLANMSHEIRTPMNGILGFTDLLRDAQLPEDQRQHFLGIIQQSGERMLNTINDIIDISKIDAGQMEIHLSEFKIYKEIESLLEFFRPQAYAKNLELNTFNKLSANEDILITDATKFNSIFSNLVKNAIKYTERGRIEIGCERKENSFFCYVKDSGAGIPENRKKAIFERFIQGDIYDRKALEGSGLGLAIAQSYAEMLGGKIWLESTEGKGSTFFFQIPWNTPAQDTNAQKKQNIGNKEQLPNDIKLLIVEDDQVNTLFLSIFLKPFCSDILTVNGGIQAVETMRKNPNINLVLMDIKMPDMDGYEATREIRKFNTDVVIIAQTAFALQGDRSTALQAGLNDYITKPIIKDKLFACIAKQLK